MGTLRRHLNIDSKPIARLRLGPPVSRWRRRVAVASMLLPVLFVWAPPLVVYLSMAVAVVLVVGFEASHRRHTRSHGFVMVDGWGVSRVDLSGARKLTRLAAWTEPFGVTLLASQARGSALLAITTPSQTRFLGVRFDGPAAAALLMQSSVVADGDALAAHAPEEASLRAEDAIALLKVVRERAPQALHRLFLSGSRGERIVLDGPELRIAKDRCFDLDSPLEWRGFLFHEALGPAASIYQATWIRQGACELVLVAPMPTELLLSTMREGAGNTKKTSRDAQLLQPNPDKPPPRELRTGIERVFMLPLREALARAPRASRNAPPTRFSSSPDAGA